MKTFAYDIESFPNLFTATFVNIDDSNETYVFYVGIDKQEINDLISFLKNEMTLIGYNNISYDNPMLRFIENYKGENIAEKMYELSQKLVNDNFRMDKELLRLRYPRDVKYSWSSIDLMTILAFDKLGISLKQTAINLKWKKIQDLPLPYYHKVKAEELPMVLEYNLNDVLITKALYEALTPLRNLRSDLSNLYNINLHSASDSKIANLILENIYSKELRLDIRAIKDQRTKREKVFLKDCIAPFIEFQTETMENLLNEIKSTVVYEYNGFKYSKSISFAGCDFNLGIGGLHTEDLPGKFESDNEYLIQDMDVASYYPNLIINNNFYPQHLGPNFIKVLKKITKERLDAKKNGDKVKADGLKITINSIFGKLGSETFWLLDPKQMFSTTLSGQLGLLMLIEDLFLNGIEVISANTDGVVCKIDRKLMDKYYEVAKRWQEKSGLELEYTPYKRYIRRDVNNYITEKEDGKTKEKGIFLKEIDLKKAYKMPIVAKALYQYFINNVPIKTTIESSKDIMDFCISQKMGGGFTLEYITMQGTKELQKTNRFFISKKGGSLVKSDSSKRRISLYVNSLATILNDYDETIPFEDYNVDFSFYEKEVMKILDEIEPKQFSLFDVSKMSKGNMEKMLTPKRTSEIVEKKINTINELNKLGKNQLAKELEKIVESKREIEEVNPRYAYVLEINKKNMSVTIYSFAKSKTITTRIDKKSYKKSSDLNIGSLIFCNKFIKDTDGWILSDFKITEKFDISGVSMM